MRLTIRQRWIDVLGWVADRPRGSAITATLLLALLASLIRAPAIDGSLVDQMAGANPQLKIAERIAFAAGDMATAAIILTPDAVSIGDVFEDLDALRSALAALDPRIELRSVDEAAPQLFAYELTTDDPIRGLLVVLRDNPQAETIINSDASRFLAIISLPEDREPEVLEIVDAFSWPSQYGEHTVLAARQLEQDVATSLRRDLRLLIPVIVGVTLVALLVAFTDWRALLLPFFASVASTVATFSLFSATVVSINLVTLLALPIVLIVGLANSCHFLAKSDADVASARAVGAVVRKTVQRVGPPFFLSTLTTAVALASLGLNELGPIANLGLIAAAALLIVFVLVMLAAPLSLRWYLSGSARSWQASRPYGAMTRWLKTWRMHVGALLLLGMLGGAVAAPLLSVKSNPKALIPDNAPFALASAEFEREFYIFSPLRVLVEGPGADQLAGLRHAGRVRDALSGHPGVRQVSLQAAANESNAFLVDALLVSDDALAPVRRTLDGLMADTDIDLVYSSASLVYSDIDRQAMESLLRSLVWSAGVIFVALLLVFWSIRAMLAAMVTNAVPLMLVCGAVWLIGSPLNLVTVFVFLVALGIIVDDSIHILFWRASGDRVSGSSIEFSVLLSTFILCLGLLLCELSDFPTTRQFASYCVIALTAAVISNLTVLPMLLGRKSDVEVLDG